MTPRMPRPTLAPPMPMLTTKDIQARMGVSRNTVYRLISTGELRAYRIGQGLRVRLDDFNKFMRDSEVGK